jgi:hypothetical protein
MLKVNGHKNKNTSRPKKTGAKKRRRVLEHKRRLMAMGIPESTVKQLTPKEMHAFLKAPKKTTAEFSS